MLRSDVDEGERFNFLGTWVTKFSNMFFITKSPMSLNIVLAKTFHFKRYDCAERSFRQE